uniref:NADH-ubiquinone oxidoreductase chain 5 n=1 Tax=Altiverruca navicula TaxID=2099647 RepID=A0A343UTD9_9CRUS|nr:NADH dehydrogenase subunit 5 [Altiverruca navicula]AVI15447.1 NADH dehydrogenase subunit 5 [Altiverruca navicula]
MIFVSLSNLIFIFLIIFSAIFFILGLLMVNVSYGLYISFNIFSWGSSDILLVFLFDWISFIFLSFVLFISGSVFYYSSEYMSGELNLARFVMLMVGFVGSMALLILSPNLISMLLGWDGLGLVSYCLVIFYQNFKSLNAGTLTVLSNRVGDVFILLGIVYMINYGDWSFLGWLGMDNSLFLVSFLIVLASLTKSAQIPFSAWLPAAMAAPTPVSSLVHSSTLVTAGVYLLIRFGWVYDFWLNEMLMIMSVLTMFMAGLGACYEFDLKKIIALSTLSQLGLMMFTLSVGMIKVAFFHLLMHALFKALLFMSAGCIIHGYKGWQDIRLMGGMLVSLPFISSSFVISNLALSGMPFLAGFYSKDLILELSLMKEISFLSLMVLFLATGLTLAYTFRLIYYTISRGFILNEPINLSDGSGVMIKSCSGLTLFSIFFGACMFWVLMDITLIVLPMFLKNLTLFVCIAGLFFGYFMSQFSFKNNRLNSFFSWMLGSMWFLPFLSSEPLIFYPLLKGNEMMKFSDLGWLELLGGQGVMSMFMKFLDIFKNFIFMGDIKIFIFIVWLMLSAYLLI